MINEKSVREHLGNVISGDVFIVDVKVTANNRITVHLDSNPGISINQCAEINRSLEALLDRDKEDFELVVSSPGLGSPLKVPEQYSKNIGRELEVLQSDGIKVTGTLSGFSEKNFTIETEDPDSHTIIPRTFEFEDIKSAKVKIKF